MPALKLKPRRFRPSKQSAPRRHPPQGFSANPGEQPDRVRASWRPTVEGMILRKKYPQSRQKMGKFLNKKWRKNLFII
jgi:hypothetical protein